MGNFKKWNLMLLSGYCLHYECATLGSLRLAFSVWQTSLGGNRYLGMSFLTTLGALIGLLTLVTTLGLLVTLKQVGRSSETEDDPAPNKIPPGGAPNKLPALLIPELAMLETQLHFLRESFGNIESLCGLFQETLLAAKDNRLDKKLLDKADETARRLDMEYLKSEVPKALRESLQTLKRIQTLIS